MDRAGTPLPFVSRSFRPAALRLRMWKTSLPLPRPGEQLKMNLQSDSITQQNTPGMRRSPLQHGCVDRLVVRRGQRISSISLKDVDWISSARNYVELHLRDEVLKSRFTLANVEALLPPRQFLRINRRTVVNLASVEVVKASSNSTIRISLIGGTELNVSRRYSARVRNVLKNIRDLQ